MKPTFEKRVDAVADEAPDGASLVAGLVALLEREIPCLGAVYYHHSPSGLVPMSGTLSSLPYAAHKHVLGPETDPLQWAGTHLRPRPRIVDASGLVPRRQILASPAYTDFYRRHEIEHVTCVWLTDNPYGSPGFTGVMIARARAHGELGETDRHRIEQVMPMLVAASITRPANEGAAPELIFDARGELLAVPEAMRAELERAEIDPRRLAREVAARLAAATDVRARRRMLLPHPRHRQTLDARVRWDATTGRGAIMLAAPGSSAAERELRTRGLTSAEMCVLQAIADGLGTEAMTADLYMSRETVRTHIKRILQKLDLPSRTQAALFMQRLLMGD